MRRFVKASLLAGVAAGFLYTVPAAGQEPLGLPQAVSTALEKNPSVRAATAIEAQADARVLQARGNYLPKINYTESLQRGTNPVYVFGSLLTQRQFGPGNFDVHSLNRPAALTNFQTQVTVDQMVFDGRQTSLAVKTAGLGRQVAGEERRRTETETIYAVVRHYYGAALAAESLRLAAESRKTAEANLRRAEALREAGMTTDADVLSIRVHLASVEEERIRAANDLQVAQAALNEVLGVPLDAGHVLTSPLTQAELPGGALPQYERTALERRPEAREALLDAQIAGARQQMARAAYLPQVAVHGVFETDRQTFASRGGSNWIVGASLRFNLWNGFSDRARVQESAAALRAAEAHRERAHSGILLEVRRAYLDVRAANQRVEVMRAAVAEAEESLRILQNRYEAGLANVTELLRADTALFAARTRRLAAVYDQRLAAVRLEQAAGTLGPDSAVLNP